MPTKSTKPKPTPPAPPPVTPPAPVDPFAPVPHPEVDTWLPPATVELAFIAAVAGLGFQADKVVLKEICRITVGPIRPNTNWQRIHARLVDTLLECDLVAGWRMAEAFPGETEVQRQAREEDCYRMLATMYLKDVANVWIWVPRG